jgi:hypothetical protein
MTLNFKFSFCEGIRFLFVGHEGLARTGEAMTNTLIFILSKKLCHLEDRRSHKEDKQDGEIPFRRTRGLCLNWQAMTK